MKLHEMIESEAWKKFMSKLELVSALVVMLGLILFSLKIESNTFFMVGFPALTLFYFFYGFTKLEPVIEISDTFFKIYGWGLAISSISLLFTLMHWPINQYSLIISAVVVLVSLVLGIIFRKEENKQMIDKFYFIRIAIALCLLGYVYYLKTSF
jgi:membrane protease YdiL (CAAX protease family)